jgi:short-subunit dehydrogenase
MHNYTLITGATSGIGLELAKEFARNGHHLIIVARTAEKLESTVQELKQLAQIEVVPIECDLAKHTSAGELYEQIVNQDLIVDVLVNNAGVGVYGEFTKTDAADELSMLNLNVISLTLLTKYFLESMVERNQGKILNIASLAAFEPGPLMSVYYASKSYVLHFTEALAEELERHSGITVSAVCPGPTDTDFAEKAGATQARLFNIPGFVMQPEDVAKAAYQGLMDKERVIIPGWQNKVSRQMERILPRTWLTKLYERLNEPVEGK